MTCSPALRRRAVVATAAASMILALGAAPTLAGPPASSPRPMLRSDTAKIAQETAAAPAPAPAQSRPATGYIRVWKAGDDIYPFNFHMLSAYRRYDLPTPPRGQVYVQLGNQVLRVKTSDWRVVAPVGKTIQLLGNVRPKKKTNSKAALVEASM